MKPSYEIFFQKVIEQATNQAINMTVKNAMSPITGVQSPLVKKSSIQRMNSHSDINGRFK